MYNNSTLTADDVKNIIITLNKDENLSDFIVRIAINDFLSLVDVVRWQHDAGSFRGRTAPTLITSAGFDLTTIADLGDSDVGMYVFKQEVKKQNILNETSFLATDRGYYIEGNKLFLTPNDYEETIIITYMKESLRILDNEALSDYTLPIPKTFEPVLRSFIKEMFFDSEYQFSLRNDVRQNFIAGITDLFKTKTKIYNF